MQTIIIASNNLGKTQEIRHAFADLPIIIRSQTEYFIEEIAETGLTFIENALIKARHVCEQTKLPALADDSGLLVAALNNAPGLYSARYAGEQAGSSANIEKLLSKMVKIPLGQRQAYFYSVLVLLRHSQDPTPLIAEGLWKGEILFSPQGTAGFGYDPIFYVPTHRCSAAELSLKEKNCISHRGIALRKMKELLANFI